ncbi:hypothetical protein P8C59_006602 [Phyllachora maydis]|uniref:WW domain-containing protein n=1 Tax=Phyllachora maydis TaxID=1825666 RepID=A0AAD9I6R7_9PEZI|nr:hypothetical protein P8C59_006602 [Phyllachora maydis]
MCVVASRGNAILRVQDAAVWGIASRIRASLRQLRPVRRLRKARQVVNGTRPRTSTDQPPWRTLRRRKTDPTLLAPTQHREEDDGWEFHWNPNTNSYWFFNRFTQVWQQENPRLQTGTAATTTISTSSTTASAAAAVPPPLRAAIEGPSAVGSVANGYNPAIHGDYDPNAWYAQEARAAEAAAAAAQEAATAAALAAAQAQAAGVEPRDEYESGGFFNARTGLWQDAEQGPDRHGDDARSRRQLNAFFDVDAAANMHDGRSLRAERAGKKPSRAELKAFKEKRKARKEEKRRAWLRD